MSTIGKFSCYKKIVGECEVSYTANPGGVVRSVLVLENKSPEACAVAVLDDVAWSATSSTFTFAAVGESLIGGALPQGFTAAGSDLIQDAVVQLPPMSIVTYMIEATIDDDAFCPSTYTNVAQVCTNKEKEPKWIASETVTIVSPATAPIDPGGFKGLARDSSTKFCVENGQRDDDQTEIIYHLMPSQDDGGKSAIVMDWIENGCRDIGDLIMAVNALLAAAELEWPKVASPLYGQLVKKEAEKEKANDDEA